MIKALYPKLSIVARGNVIKVMGDEEEMCGFEENTLAMNSTVPSITAERGRDIGYSERQKDPERESAEDTIVYSVNGKPIAARSENQQRLVIAYEKNDMLFAIGPAGSGKTYTAIALAVRALKEQGNTQKSS